MVLLDGAHNPDGVRGLVDELSALAAGRRVHLVFSVMRDKDWPAMVDLLAPVASRVTVTAALSRRAAAPADLAARFASSVPVEVNADPRSALQAALAAADERTMILVCGSLFLVGEVYPYFLTRAGRRSVFELPETTLHP
jgi:dihydrofolate synthase/folylpolyglutamate synthase